MSNKIVSKDGNSRGAQKKRTVKRPRDDNAPVQPKSGFMRFMCARRAQLVLERPGVSSSELSKVIGAEWNTLSNEGKRTYLEDAAAERTEYLKQLLEYKKTDAYKLFRKKLKQQRKDGSEDDFSAGHHHGIQIFSKEFLEHNRERERELRKLRCEAVRLEEEQSALGSNIKRLKSATEQLEVDVRQQREHGQALRTHLDSYRQALVQAFAHMPFPGTNVVPTISTIDNYMNNLHKLVLEAPGEHQDFVAKIRDIVTKLKLPATSF